MNKELITLFFSMEHESDELIDVFNKEQLLDFYISGCELRLRMERRFEDFNKFHKETGITLGNLLLNKTFTSIIMVIHLTHQTIRSGRLQLYMVLKKIGKYLTTPTLLMTYLVI